MLKMPHDLEKHVVNKIEGVNIFANCNGVFSYTNFSAWPNGGQATLLKLFWKSQKTFSVCSNGEHAALLKCIWKLKKLFPQGQMLSPREL